METSRNSGAHASRSAERVMDVRTRLNIDMAGADRAAKMKTRRVSCAGTCKQPTWPAYMLLCCGHLHLRVLDRYVRHL